MAGVTDKKFLEEIGLDTLPMMQNRGAVAAEKFDQILDVLKPLNKSVNPATKGEMANTLNTWIHMLMPDQKQSIFEPKIGTILDLIGELTVSTDDAAINESEEYVGDVYVASELSQLIANYSMMDFSGGLHRQYCQKSFNVLESILVQADKNPAIQFINAVPMQRHDTSADYRSKVAQVLVRYMPNQGNFELSNGMKVISMILTPKNRFPLLLVNDAKTSLNILSTSAKSSIAHSTRAILDIVKLGGNDSLLTAFMTMPELYTNDPEAVHENLNIFFKQPYMQYAHFLSTVAAKNAQVLMPHLTFFIDQLANTPMVGTITLMTLESLAKYDANLLYTKTSIIVEKSKNVTNGTVILAKVLAAIGLADNAADSTILLLVDLLEASANDQYAAPGLLAAISNVMTHMSNIDILAKQIPRIEKFKQASEISFTAIKDFAAGRSLETLTNRVDEMEARITQMNHKISETCTSMADVIAYVDANMADMKDFLAEVVKKLPNPKRLEVVGTLRKTLVLHFECCRTGLEFPIISHEWSKWLKMGFSLIKAGKAVIDIGMGNPLGLLATGITAVQEIYEAYKTNDDDEFNTYITEPFLTSAEQDQLINKLRDQGFFEVFAYDSQKAGWYLLHPEKDGRRPEGDAGSVTKVWRKDGYGGVAETALEIGSTLVMGYINSGGELDQLESTESILSGENAVTINTGKKKDSEGTKNPIVSRDQAESKAAELKESSSSKSQSPPSNYQSGGRAQAMKEKMNPTTVAMAEASVKEASKTAEYYAKVDDYEKRIRSLEANVAALQGSVEELRNQRASCACIIS